MTFPNSQKLKKALKELELLVVMDLFLTETAKCANIVLPSASFLEKTELSSVGRLSILKKVIPEEGESRSDWDFVSDLAKHMGYEDYFPWKSIEEYIVFRLQNTGLTIESLKKRQIGVDEIFHYRKYKKTGFATPSGKVEIFSEKLQEYGYEPLPEYINPENGMFDEMEQPAVYPFILNLGSRRLEYINSQLRNIHSLHDRLPEPFAEIHPKSAEELGISEGDTIVVETTKGKLRIRATINENTLPQVVRIPHGWIEANVNTLTDDGHRDPISGFPAFKSMRCKIRKSKSGVT